MICHWPVAAVSREDNPPSYNKTLLACHTLISQTNKFPVGRNELDTTLVASYGAHSPVELFPEAWKST